MCLTSSIWKVKADRSGVQGHPWLCREFEINFSDIKPYLKRKGGATGRTNETDQIHKGYIIDHGIIQVIRCLCNRKLIDTEGVVVCLCTCMLVVVHACVCT